MREITARKRKLIFINILIACIATTMMSTALTTALPPIISELQISATTGQWLSSGYSLGMGIMIPITAFLLTRFRTVRLYETSLLVFIVGLILCIIARGFPMLMFGRILQACANGVLTAMGQVVLLSIYPEEEKGSVMGLYGLSVGAAPVLAPTLTGILIDHFNWRIIFVLPLVIMIIAFVFAKMSFYDILPVQKKPFDYISFILCILTFGGITFGLGNIGANGLFDSSVFVPLVIGLIAGAFFVKRQLGESDPFLNLRVFSNRQFTLSVIGSITLFFVTMATTLILPMYFQNMKGYSATVSGLSMLPGSVVLAVVSPFAGKIYDRIGMKKILMVASISMLISNIGMCFVQMSTPNMVVVLLNVLRQFSVGLLLMTFVAWGTDKLPGHQVTDGTVLITSLRTIAGSLGMSITVGIMTQISDLTRTFSEVFTIQGLEGAFVFLTLAALVLVFVAVVVMRNRRNGLQDN